MAETLWKFNLSALPNATDPNAKSPEYIVNKIPTKFCLEPEPYVDKRFYKAIFAPHSDISQDSPSIIGSKPRMAFVWNVRCTKIEGSKITLKFYAEPLWKNIKYYYISFTGDLYSMSKNAVDKVTNVDSLLKNGSELVWISKKVNGQNERILNYYGLALSYCANSLPTQYNVSNTKNADTQKHSGIDTDILSKQDNSFVTSTITLDLTTIPSRELYFKLKFGSWVGNAGYARPLTLASVIKDYDWDTEANSSSSKESPPQSSDNINKPESGIMETFSTQYGESCYYDSGVAWTRIIMPTPRSSIYYYKDSKTPILIKPGNLSYYKKNGTKIEPTQNVQVYYYKEANKPTLVYGYPNSYFYK